MTIKPNLNFLTWESPWPAQDGGTIRMLGLLKQLSKAYAIHLVVLSKEPLSGKQEEYLYQYVTQITRVQMLSVKFIDKLKFTLHMILHWMPSHCAILDRSFSKAQDLREYLRTTEDIIYANFGHWGTLIRDRKAPNWILDQQNADVQFWRVFISHARDFRIKSIVLLNWLLAHRHFKRIYPGLGMIISVCEEDKALTKKLGSSKRIEVIENGVDSSYYSPDIETERISNRILFTGTSRIRNMTALHDFVDNIFPMILQHMPDVHLLVAGNFSVKAQAEFKKHTKIYFTGWVEDIRPSFNSSTVYIAPFKETHGSKLKISEAISMGLPIVSTPEGVRGFKLTNGVSVLIAQDNEEFAQHVIHLLKNPGVAKKIGAQARQVAVNTLDWDILGVRLRQCVAELYEQNKNNN